jgi:hypothetical protein
VPVVPDVPVGGGALDVVVVGGGVLLVVVFVVVVVVVVVELEDVPLDELVVVVVRPLPLPLEPVDPVEPSAAGPPPRVVVPAPAGFGTVPLERAV